MDRQIQLFDQSFKVASAQSMSDESKIKVLYDARCGLCEKEINFYKSIAPQQTFLWCDLCTNSKLLEAYQLDLKDALLVLHVIDQKGIMHIGVDAFSVIWKNIPILYCLGIIIKAPCFYQISKLGYEYFAKWRFNRLGYCELHRFAIENESKLN